ncbi:unnamed protein product [Prorocentrum cordatum]|uniref:Reverse transcriptase domain-containing protein n=1 Tax=Prorocentrum cordatum TaxID=2364126 RepID=A0ABN9S9C4_9DINO|nr:unnamed protein product [Polarella glacialis]
MADQAPRGEPLGTQRSGRRQLLGAEGVRDGAEGPPAAARPGEGEAGDRSRSPPAADPFGRLAPASALMPSGPQAGAARAGDDNNLSDLIEKELKDYMNSDLKTSIKKASTTLAAKIESLQKTNARKTKLEAELQSLRGGTIPAGVKPANFGFETDLLDTVTLQDTSYDIRFDSGCTIRDAKRKLHIFYLEKCRELDLRVVEEQRTRLRQYTRKDNFIDRLLAERTSIDSGWNTLDLDLEVGDGPHGVSESSLRAKGEAIYTKLKKPADHLSTAIDLKLREALRKRTDGSSSASGANAHLEASIRQLQKGDNIQPSDLADVIAKNSLAPASSGGVGAGKSKAKGKNKTGGKGKAGGKGKDKPPSTPSQPPGKGSSKGKDKWKASSKGKAKGKSKGKTGRGRGSSRGGGKDLVAMKFLTLCSAMSPADLAVLFDTGRGKPGWYMADLTQRVACTPPAGAIAWPLEFLLRHRVSSLGRPTNLNGVAELALDLLRNSPVGACITDKDGGFAVLPKAAIHEEKLRVLASDFYSRVAWHEAFAVEAMTEYCEAAQSFDDEDLVKVLQRLPHLLTNTEQLQRQLSALTLPRGCVFCKLDIKDFYMSGEHGLLINECARHIAEGREHFRAMLSSIVRNQYVCLSDDFDAHPFVYRVLRGTGMGLCCSGEVSDLVFYSTVEEPFVLRSDIRREYGIVFYGRFRDDILCISSRPDLLHEMLQRMQALSRCFDLTIDCIDPVRTIMLDLSLSFCDRGDNVAVEHALRSARRVLLVLEPGRTSSATTPTTTLSAPPAGAAAASSAEGGLPLAAAFGLAAAGLLAAGFAGLFLLRFGRGHRLRTPEARSKSGGGGMPDPDAPFVV